MYASLWKGNPYIAYDRPPMRVGEYVYVRDATGVSLWRHCYAQQDLVFGDVLRENASITSGANADTAWTAGTNIMTDTAIFTQDEEIYEGAWVQTIGILANGGGQAAYIRRKVSDNVLTIHALFQTVSAGTISRIIDGNWATTVATAASYDITKPGRVSKATNAVPACGVCQTDGGIDQSDKPYFFAKCSGLCWCIGEDTESPFHIGEEVYVSVSADGRVEGPTDFTTPTTAELQAAAEDARCPIGIARSADPSFLSGVLVDVSFPLYSQTQHFPRTKHPLATVNP